jgi:hypothetical protein
MYSSCYKFQILFKFKSYFFTTEKDMKFLKLKAYDQCSILHNVKKYIYANVHYFHWSLNWNHPRKENGTSFYVDIKL